MTDDYHSWQWRIQRGDQAVENQTIPGPLWGLEFIPGLVWGLEFISNLVFCEQKYNVSHTSSRPSSTEITKLAETMTFTTRPYIVIHLL